MGQPRRVACVLGPVAHTRVEFALGTLVGLPRMFARRASRAWLSRLGVGSCAGLLGVSFGVFVGLQVDLDENPDWWIIWTALGVAASFAVVVVALVPIWSAWSIRVARRKAVRRLFHSETEAARYVRQQRAELPSADDRIPLQGLLDQLHADVLALAPIEIEILYYAVRRVRDAWSSPVSATALFKASEVLEMAQLALSGELDLARAESVGDVFVQHSEWRLAREEALLSAP